MANPDGHEREEKHEACENHLRPAKVELVKRQVDHTLHIQRFDGVREECACCVMIFRDSGARHYAQRNPRGFSGIVS